MRSRLNILVATAAMALVVPQFAMADDVEEQLRLMNERMGQMEDQLQAAQDELDASREKVEHQQSVIQKAGLDREAKSGLSGFFEQVNVSGWAAVSYFYNFNDPDTTTIFDQNVGAILGGGTNGPVAPFHPDHNSFSVDQIWIGIEKPVSEESRAGFRTDIVYGRTGSLLGGASWNRACANPDDVVSNLTSFGGGPNPVRTVGCEGDNASDLHVQQAYVQYLTPFGPTLKAGKFETLIGYETVETTANFNITRGNVWTLLQPITHYGVMLDGETEGGIVYALGAVNSVRGIDPDSNNDKSITGRLGFNGETLDGSINFIWGREDYGNGSGDAAIIDMILAWNPNEKFSGWINGTFSWRDRGSPANGFLVGFPTTNDSRGWGIAAAGRYAFTDRLGFALRGEYASDKNGLFGLNNFGGPFGPVGGQQSNQVWGITGTVDYLLAENLTLKAELRYDRVKCRNTGFECDVFVGNNSGDLGILFGNFVGLPPTVRTDQLLGGVELT